MWEACRETGALDILEGQLRQCATQLRRTERNVKLRRSQHTRVFRGRAYREKRKRRVYKPETRMRQELFEHRRSRGTPPLSRTPATYRHAIVHTYQCLEPHLASAPRDRSLKQFFSDICEEETHQRMCLTLRLIFYHIGEGYPRCPPF